MQDLRPYQSLSDDTLLKLYREKNDNRLLGLVLQRYTTLLLATAFKYLKNQTAAEDAAQHILLQALMHFPVEPVANLKGWLYVLMRNHCLSITRNRVHMAGEEAMYHIAGDETVDEQQLWQEELKLQRMQELLQQLPEQQQTALRAFYLQNKSYEDICRETGYNFMQVKSYIQNGKRKLRLLMINDAQNAHHE